MCTLLSPSISNAAPSDVVPVCVGSVCEVLVHGTSTDMSLLVNVYQFVDIDSFICAFVFSKQQLSYDTNLAQAHPKHVRHMCCACQCQ